MMSLARPLADSARAQTPRYQLPAITWLLISSAPSTPAGFQESSPSADLDFSPFSTLAWCEQSGFGWRRVLGFVSQGLQDFLSLVCPCLSSFLFCVFPPFEQTERTRRLHPPWLHAGVDLNWICLVVGWLILGGRPFMPTSLRPHRHTDPVNNFWAGIKQKIIIITIVIITKILNKGRSNVENFSVYQ